MKNAMKKLMAFALVAVMLVGALPFQALAVECDGTHTSDDGCEAAPGSHLKTCFKACNGTESCYSATVLGSAEGAYHAPGCAGQAALEAGLVYENGAWVDPNATPEPEFDPTDTNNCTMGDDCQVVVPYHKAGCVKIAEHDEPIDDGKECTHDFNCEHTGNLHVAGCPMIPCTGDADCDHGGFNHKPGCPFACNGKSNCPQGANQDPRYHVDGCASLKVEEDDKNEDENEDIVVTDEYIGLIIKVEGDGVVKQTKVKKDGVSINYLLKNYWYSTWADDYDFVSYKLDDGTKGSAVADYIYAGEIVTVYLKEEVKTSKLNSNKVYLHVFMNNDFDDPAKNINITNGIAADGKLDLYSDVKSVIKEYFSAKDSDGIKYDGMYISTGNWAGDFLTDTKDETITNVDELKEEGYVHLNVMITNAKLKSSSSADSSNPKTGDNIMMAVSVMTLSASALAVFFYLNKKRAVK